jgi:phage terminase small subunit
MPENVCISEEKQPLTPKQARLVEALLEGKSLVESARYAGCNEKTARIWLKIPVVDEAYQEAQRRLFDESISILRQTNQKAITTLIVLLESDTDSVRLRAAQCILDHNIQMVKISELEANHATILKKLEELGIKL